MYYIPTYISNNRKNYFLENKKLILILFCISEREIDF